MCLGRCVDRVANSPQSVDAMKPSIKAVLFDLDDTLFDRSKAQRLVLEGILRRFPAIFGSLPPERVARAFEESDRLAVAEFDAGAPSDGLREMRSRTFLRLSAFGRTILTVLPHSTSAITLQQRRRWLEQFLL